MINNFPTTAHFCASPKKSQNADFYTTHTHQLYIPQLKQPISPDYLHLLQPYLLDSQLHWLKWLMQVQKYCILRVTSIPKTGSYPPQALCLSNHQLQTQTRLSGLCSSQLIFISMQLLVGCWLSHCTVPSVSAILTCSKHSSVCRLPHLFTPN